jgi:hypothetical protein
MGREFNGTRRSGTQLETRSEDGTLNSLRLVFTASGVVVQPIIMGDKKVRRLPVLSQNLNPYILVMQPTQN